MKVPRQPDKKKESAATNNHEGLVILGFTAKQLEVRQVLLEPGVTNYFHAARRLAITENAVKKRMSASYSMVSRARQVIKEDDDWKKARALAKKGIFPKEMMAPC